MKKLFFAVVLTVSLYSVQSVNDYTNNYPDSIVQPENDRDTIVYLDTLYIEVSND